MLDLSQLAHASVSAGADARQAAAEEHYRGAIVRLEAYNQSQEPALLTEALKALTQAVRAYRRHVDAYVLMAKIYLSVQLPALTLKYLRAAEAIQPNHPELAEIKMMLSTSAYPARMPIATLADADDRRDHAELDDDELDFAADLFYDEAREQILLLNRLVSEFELPEVPTAEVELLNRYRLLQQKLKQKLADLSRELDQLDAEIDVSSLRLQLEPAYGLLTRLAERLRTGKALVQLMREHEAIERLVRSEFAARILRSERLEVILDRFDSLADRLDALEAQGVPIQAHVTRYRELKTRILLLQERLDEQTAML